MNKILFTIFTPTYNRAYTLKRLYCSLRNQGIFNFEWLIVDDGSVDDTKNIVSSFNQDKFKINYVYQENSGKHIAINTGLDLAKGEYFFIVDSDDYLLPNAICLATSKIEEFKISALDDFAGISFNRGFPDKKLIGKTFSGEFLDATNLERKRCNILGDKAEIYKKSVLRKYKFPEFDGEKFLSEMVVWNRIANDGYKIRWFNSIIYITDYLEDGLTHNSLRCFSKSPQGYALMIMEHIKFGRLGILEQLKYYWQYYKVISLEKNITLNDVSNVLHVPLYKVFIGFLLGQIKGKLGK